MGILGFGLSSPGAELGQVHSAGADHCTSLPSWGHICWVLMTPAPTLTWVATGIRPLWVGGRFWPLSGPISCPAWRRQAGLGLWERMWAVLREASRWLEFIWGDCLAPQPSLGHSLQDPGWVQLAGQPGLRESGAGFLTGPAAGLGVGTGGKTRAGLTSGMEASSGPGALAPLVPLLRPQGPDWASGFAPWGGSGLGVWAVWGLNLPGRPTGLGASWPRPHSERSRGLSGTRSSAAVASFPLGLPGPAGCRCCPLGTSLSDPSESEPIGGEGSVSPGLGGPLILAPPACPRARSCWARSRLSAPSSRGSCMSTRVPGRPSRPEGASQASASPAFRVWGWGPSGAAAGARGLLWGLRRCRDRGRFRRQRRSAWRACFRDS